MSTKFHEANRASEVLSKIGKGAADADFARAVHQALDRAQATMKKCKVRVEVEFEPDEERGCMLVRAEVSTKLAKLPPPASQMHLGDGNQLLTQQEWLLGGGRNESTTKPLPIEQAAQASSPSGRFPVAKAPTPAPVADAPAPAPLAGETGKKD